MRKMSIFYFCVAQYGASESYNCMGVAGKDPLSLHRKLPVKNILYYYYSLDDVGMKGNFGASFFAETKNNMT